MLMVFLQHICLGIEEDVGNAKCHFFQKEKNLHNDILKITTFLEELRKQTIFIAFCSTPYFHIYI